VLHYEIGEKCELPKVSFSDFLHQLRGTITKKCFKTLSINKKFSYWRSLSTMDGPIQNANPLIVTEKHQDSMVVLNPYLDLDMLDEHCYEYVTSDEIFDHIRNLMDPEHPLTLEQLNVVCSENISVEDPGNTVSVLFTPTIPHCSMATLIGLCLRVKLLRVLPARFKVTIKIYPGSHQSEEAVNKQLNDKERVAAALENKHLLDVVNKCIRPAGGS